MARLIALLCCLAPALLLAQPTARIVYDDLERQYYELVGSYLDSGNVCPARSSEVIQKQKELASALSGATPSTGPRVMLFAVAANSLVNVRRLNEGGASPAGDNGSLLHIAARFADPPTLEYLASIGFGVEDLGGASGPALIVAVTSNRLDNAAWLIEHGANVNATDTAGGPVLRHALACKDQALVDLLLKAGAVPDAMTREVAARLDLRL